MKSLLAVVCLSSFTTLSYADWTLNLDDSSFSFASIKKNHAYEVHTFNRYEGRISDAGEAELTLDLASVQTGIEIRDQRMQSMLFDTPKFPAASYRVKVDPTQLKALKPGQRLAINAEGSLSIFGIEKPLPAALNVFKLGDNRLQVNTARPIALKAQDYGLDGGIEALRKIANLPVISLTVPVNFSLVFDQQ
ncbi:YceI family protein [Motiliproteus coralliicola]|uniref:YceI family protein n=1 Tax=Motiliproteus coralliicola TaxID=2283196 RepID=A0A369WTU6_9GAMM|nr:YceI family protein [Motiliproteus coralliicola]RDE25021.1 YceI family protein [Motiliproteus coralliicola]